MVERDRRWSARGNLTLPLSEEGLYFVTEGAVRGGVEFVEDPSLKDSAVIDFHVEYDDWVFSHTKFCMLENVPGTGVGIFVSDNSLFRDTRQQSDFTPGPEIHPSAKLNAGRSDGPFTQVQQAVRGGEPRRFGPHLRGRLW